MKVISNKNAKIFGDSCGKHGTYTFYPGLQFTAHNQTHYLTLGKFFYALLNFPSPCGAAPKSLKAVGELQLVWHDKNHQDGDLCSVKFYIKPEDCPDGRQPHHGQIAGEFGDLHLKPLDILFNI
ncbi:hypothetical protein HELRODRAFT_158364 [Helobdella robusta]|uniref:Uncharacterized protein n=1 Tax=Helobdella robusta TaxID=6412 RepID=T1EMP9_HELRO|nr:hypothetical protein HELRODRAFT_158364 [Helobdella robusta]ESO11983.1 hypothetical protein HELRODRAFT_158364 [Helobdella robusta]